MSDFHTPMARLAVETALLANATNLMTFVGFMIKKLKEVKNYKSECSKLVNISIELSLSYIEHNKDLRRIRSGEAFLRSLQKVYLLVIECSQSWSVFHVGWEYFFDGKIEKLTKELSRCQKVFNTEALININSTSTDAAASLVAMKAELVSIGQSVSDYQGDRARFNQSINDIRREIEDNREERNSWLPTKPPTYPVIKSPDDRIVVDGEQDDTELTGQFEGQAVVFQSISGFFPSRSRIIKIYQMIAEAAPPNMMQRLYGVYERDGAEFLIMENGHTNLTLLDFVHSKKIQNLTMSQKVSFCYDLVSLITILHGLDLVVKSITDVNILVQCSDGENPRPKLINIHYIRRRRDPSGREDIDWRFDSPETPGAGTRSKMSDIWSLGIILAEVFTGSLPFSTGPCSRSDYAKTHHVPSLSLPPTMSQTETAELTARQVASVGSQTQPAFVNLESSLPAVILELVNSALASNPMLRSSASKLAQELFEILLRETNVASNDLAERSTLVTKLDTKMLEQMMQQVKERKYAEALAKTKREPLPPRKTIFETQQMEQLLNAAQHHPSEPAVLHAVGSAYLWGLCAISEQMKASESGLPADVLFAEEALTYLKPASEQGYESTEELYHAHKVLAKFYHDKLTSKNSL